MRRLNGNDRLIHNEATAALVDAPQNETYVEDGCSVSITDSLTIDVAAGEVSITGEDVDVVADSETVTDITGEVEETAYRYHTVSVDATGSVVVRQSEVGEFDETDADAPPITQVTEPEYDGGEVYLGTVFQIEGSLERVFDGRQEVEYIGSSVVVTDPDEPEPPVGDRGDVWYPLTGTGGDGVWSFETDNVRSGVAVADGVVYAGSDDNSLYAVDAEDGTEVWSFSTGGDIRSGVAVADGVVYAGSFDDSLYAVDASEGTEVWSFSTGGLIFSGVTVADGVVYAGSDGNSLYARFAQDGSRYKQPRLSNGTNWISQA